MIKNIMNAFSSAGTAAGNISQPQAPAQAPSNPVGVPNTPQGNQLSNTEPSQRNLDPAQNHPTLDPRPQPSADEGKSPLEAFVSLFHNEDDSDKSKNKKATEYDPNAPIFNLDEDQFSKQVSTMNFIPTDVREALADRLANGDTDAMFELIESAMRSGYSQNAKFSALAAQEAAKVAMERGGRAVPGLLKGELTRQELATQNKLFSDPAIKPMAEGIAQQYRQKYPDASAADIARYTQHYFDSVVKAFTGQAGDTKGKPQASGESEHFDFSNFWGN